MKAETSMLMEAPRTCPVDEIGTGMSRARCRQPARIERMKQSLIAYGQMNPLIAAERKTGIELVDGFQRLWAAKALGWTSLKVTTRSFDERGQWAAMLLLNRAPHSMMVLEEALVLLELTKTGMSQSELSSLLGRDKSWVSRRIALVEKLHPELIASMKIGLLHPGVARRLLALPPSNQLELAAASQSSKLGAKETETLVSLWKAAKDTAHRKAILYDPKGAIRAATAKKSAAIDPRLSPTGQRLQRFLRNLQTEASTIIGLLHALENPEDLRILKKEIVAARQRAQKLVTALGSDVSNVSGDEESEPSDGDGSSSCTTREKGTGPSRASSASM